MLGHHLDFSGWLVIAVGLPSQEAVLYGDDVGMSTHHYKCNCMYQSEVLIMYLPTYLQNDHALGQNVPEGLTVILLLILSAYMLPRVTGLHLDINADLQSQKTVITCF